MSFREIPFPIEHVLVAARRVHPTHSLFVTYAPESQGPAWELHTDKRWLVFRTLDEDQVVEAVACSLLARVVSLGKGAVTDVPQPLRFRYEQARDALVTALSSEARATRSR